MRILQRAIIPGGILENALNRVVPNGSTVLHDALTTGAALARADSRPAVFLILTDGEDTGSWSTASAALDAIRQAHVVVYPVGAGLPNVPMASADSDYMRERAWPRRDPLTRCGYCSRLPTSAEVSSYASTRVRA